MAFAEGVALASQVQAQLKAAWGTIMGVPMSEAQWSLACFPIRHDGLGVTDPARIHAQAAVAAFLAAADGDNGRELGVEVLSQGRDGLPQDPEQPASSYRAGRSAAQPHRGLRGKRTITNGPGHHSTHWFCPCCRLLR